VLEIRLDRFVLLVEVSQVGDEILDDVGVRERVELDIGGRLGRDPAWSCCQQHISTDKASSLSSAGRAARKFAKAHTQAGEGVLAVDVHGTASTDTLTATSPESKGRVELVLDADESVQDHGAGLVEVERVGLHAGLFGRLLGVPAVDGERLHARLLLLLGGRRLAHGSHRPPGENSRAGAVACGGEGDPRGHADRAADSSRRRAESGHLVLNAPCFDLALLRSRIGSAMVRKEEAKR
jgi:hypothetical protein